MKEYKELLSACKVWADNPITKNEFAIKDIIKAIEIHEQNAENEIKLFNSALKDDSK